MNKLDPQELLSRIAADVPADLHKNVFLTGSLAAAYCFQAKLEGRAVNTKDADLVVHPFGDVARIARMAMKLRELGWSRTDECYPRAKPSPADELRAIRLYPPDSHDYFLEFLGLPRPGQTQPKEWLPIEIDGWYGLPSFRFQGLTARYRLTASVGIEYASPAMMALANLLSHPTLGSVRIESGNMIGVLRSAKDLGRVLALAHLTEREETEKWPFLWLAALQECFPKEWRTLAARAGDGLKELLADEDVLEEARRTMADGLLEGMNLSSSNLKATGRRIFVDVLDPLGEMVS
jgi:hypothetical protein